MDFTPLISEVFDFFIDVINFLEMDIRFFNLFYFFDNAIFFLPRNALSMQTFFELIDTTFKLFSIVINWMNVFLFKCACSFRIPDFVVDSLYSSIDLLLLICIDLEFSKELV